MASAACDGAGEGHAGPDSPGPDPASPQADLRRAAVGASAAARAASGGIEKGVDLLVALGAGAGLLAAVCARDNAFLRRPAIPGGQCGAMVAWHGPRCGTVGVRRPLATLRGAAPRPRLPFATAAGGLGDGGVGWAALVAAVVTIGHPGPARRLCVG